MSRNDDGLRFYGLYNLVQTKATGRIGMYLASILACPEQGGNWMKVRFEDGTEWRYRPDELVMALRLCPSHDIQGKRWQSVIPVWPHEGAAN